MSFQSLKLERIEISMSRSRTDVLDIVVMLNLGENGRLDLEGIVAFHSGVFFLSGAVFGIEIVNEGRESVDLRALMGAPGEGDIDFR